MKKFILALFALVAFSSANTFAQCDDEDFLDKCSESLDNFTFIKSFEHPESKGTSKSEFSYVFSKDHMYVVTACDQMGGKFVVNLYDRNHKLIASNKTSGKLFPKIGYQCTATGVYYIETYFEVPPKGCGISILGFKK